MVSEEMKAFCHQMMDYRLPRWSELPGFDIYMDQLITLVRQYLALPILKRMRSSPVR